MSIQISLWNFELLSKVLIDVLYKIPILRSINILVHIEILNRHIQSFRTYYGDSVYGYASSMQVNT